VVQLVRGKGFQFVTCHPWTLSPAPGPRRPGLCPYLSASEFAAVGPIYPISPFSGKWRISGAWPRSQKGR